MQVYFTYEMYILDHQLFYSSFPISLYILDHQLFYSSFHISLRKFCFHLQTFITNFKGLYSVCIVLTEAKKQTLHVLSCYKNGPAMILTGMYF